MVSSLTAFSTKHQRTQLHLARQWEALNGSPMQGSCSCQHLLRCIHKHHAMDCGTQQCSPARFKS